MLRSILKFAILAVTLAAPTSKGSVSGPAIDQNFPDPAFIEADGLYYAFATTNGNGIPFATSKDFKKWTVSKQPALEKVGDWSTGEALWAPDVKKIKGKYVMYYTALPKGGGKHCLGAASSTKPAGPYTAEPKALVCNEAAGGVIDPFGYVQYDGSVWLIYKIDGNSIGHGGSCGNTVAPQVSTAIMAQRLSDDGLSVHSSAPTKILDRSAADGPLVEAPAILRVPNGKSATYFLFFSSHCYSSGQYDSSYAVSHNGLLGPYVKADRTTSPLLKTGYPNKSLYAPGGLSVGLAGDNKVIFHADRGQTSATRVMWTGVLALDAEKGIASLG